MFQRVTLIGNVGQDPELRYTQSQTAVTNLSVATTKRVKNSQTQQWEPKTEWHRVVLWQKNAENASKYLRKGSKVHIEGELETRTYEDKQGQKRYQTEIVAQQWHMLDKREQSNDQQYGEPQNHGLDDIPF